MTDNMGLVSIDSSDYVSPTDINNNFKKLDVLGLDYVVKLWLVSRLNVRQ